MTELFLYKSGFTTRILNYFALFRILDIESYHSVIRILIKLLCLFFKRERIEVFMCECEPNEEVKCLKVIIRYKYLSAYNYEFIFQVITFRKKITCQLFIITVCFKKLIIFFKCETFLFFCLLHYAY